MAMTTNTSYEVQKGRIDIDTPPNKRAKFVTSNELIQVKSEMQPATTLPTVFETPEKITLAKQTYILPRYLTDR